MYIKQEIITLLLESVIMRGKLATALGIGSPSVYKSLVKYKESPFKNSVFTKIAAINFLKQEGYTEEQILSVERPTNINN